MLERKMVRSRGFTLVELVVAMAIMVIALGLAMIWFRGTQQHGQARAAMRRLMSIANEARSSALALGTASMTSRAIIVDPATSASTCPSEFSLNGSTAFGRAGLLFELDTSTGCFGPTPCDLVTYVSGVDRIPAPVAGWAGDTYLIRCDRLDIRYSFGKHSSGFYDAALDVIRFDAPGFNMSPGSSSGSYFIAYDARGLVTNPPSAGVARVSVKDQTMSQMTHGILILGSGLACLEGNAFECAQN